MKALTVDLYRPYGQTRAAKGAARAEIARLFDPGRIADVGGDPRQQIESGLRSVQHHDLIRLRAEPTGCRQMVGNGALEFQGPGDFAVVEPPDGGPSGGAVDVAGPKLVGKEVQRRQSGGERSVLVLRKIARTVAQALSAAREPNA
ncbi:hypothetical protein DEM25_009915 [Oceaniradius stylonematis]|uniref:Uncharacterized protein n=1 Tax=Oceaniradius stylonematis TaxID=2184161 RepID=A0A3A8AM03_9HYPH|nr:hypothetical protein DEM25_009915 [Oceaniradius stylonematis]RNC91284.1 MAG: hypothetical protein ED558_15220 [Oricola sp.]